MTEKKPVKTKVTKSKKETVVKNTEKTAAKSEKPVVFTGEKKQDFKGQLAEEREKLLQLKLAIEKKKSKDTSAIRKSRKKIAQIMTAWRLSNLAKSELTGTPDKGGNHGEKGS